MTDPNWTRDMQRMAKYANLRDGGNLPPQPGLIRRVLFGAVVAVVVGYALVFVVMMGV